jgi:uncharacterized protein with HEPN domain
MSNKNRDISILARILEYCEDIEDAKSVFGNSLDILQTNKHYRHSVVMCILQIGELTTHLSEPFKSRYNQMPWKDIKSMRNIAAHQYGEMSINLIWRTMCEDIPTLYEYCCKAKREMLDDSQLPNIYE